MATLISGGVYLALGLGLGRRTKGLGDHLPVTHGRLARVANPKEFSASTVAASISLATVVMYFFEAGPYFGLWLLWTVLTTAVGFILVRVAARKIWDKMLSYEPHRPTLHEFLGTEYGSKHVGLIGAACTSLGFLGAFAVELTVGSRFLANLVPSVPALAVVFGLALISLTYTSAGGFRAVIVTDRMQMRSIWIMLLALLAFYAVFIWTHGGWLPAIDQVPSAMKDFSWREGLSAFLIGISIINVPTYIADMSMWQRFAGSQDRHSVFSGLWRSVGGASLTWTLFIVLACLAPAIVTLSQNENPLLTLLNYMGTSGVFGLAILFLVILGLYGAMFSTASTQLVAVSHTIHTDILRRQSAAIEGGDANSKREVRISRIIICTTAMVAMFFVEILTAAGFSIADLIFAVYGAQLGLFPPTLLALHLSREKLKRLAPWITFAISSGFVLGWSMAGYGRYVGDANLVFLAPLMSLLVSSLATALGWCYSKTIYQEAV
ncbi:MAG TPA: hypothetical protein VJ302_27755 [Blastocatellia bacterium]|nr:hypothetical protein [Blastocatellia bacterium]